MTDDPTRHDAVAKVPEKKRGALSFARGDAARTVVKLAIASVIVGAVLAFLGVSPIGFWRSVFESFQNLLSFIGDSAAEIAINLATYLFFGALIVVPVWFVMRLLSNKKRG